MALVLLVVLVALVAQVAFLALVSLVALVALVAQLALVTRVTLVALVTLVGHLKGSDMPMCPWSSFFGNSVEGPLQSKWNNQNIFNILDQQNNQSKSKQ